MSTDERHKQYWQTNLKVLSGLLSIWFLFSCVLSIILVEPLNKMSLGGFPLGFWIAQQGSIVVFIFIILAYAIIMRKVDHKFRVSEDDPVEAKPTEPNAPDAAVASTDTKEESK